MKDKLTSYLLKAVVSLFAVVAIINAQQQAAPHLMQQDGKPAMQCPMMQGGDKSQASTKPDGSRVETMAEMNMRGDKVMGFSQAKTIHHFRLLPDGGAVEVGANDAKDTVSRNQIRQHLGHIAQMFANGNFNAPMLIHGREPSGVPTMQKLKGDIKYQLEETEIGGRVRISTSNREALAAIYEFLRFQIKEHQTGDSLEVKD